MDQFTPEIKQLIEVAVIVLIPMIPALILYAVLPSRATVSGPFKGLNIRLQGAFGGYFVLVLVVVGWLRNGGFRPMDRQNMKPGRLRDS